MDLIDLQLIKEVIFNSVQEINNAVQFSKSEFYVLHVYVRSIKII